MQTPSPACRISAPAAALLALAAPGSAAAGSGTIPTTIVHASEGTATPKARTLSGGSWGAEQNLDAGAGEPKWMVAHHCPKREEVACLTYNANKRVYLSFNTGSGWSDTTMLCSSAGADHKRRGCDAAYESTTGDLLVAYWKGSGSVIGFRTCSGGTISTESTLTLTGAVGVRWVTLYADPGSDDVLLLALDEDSRLFGAVWTGAAFSPASTLSTNLESKEYECFTAAYETGTGEALIVYSQKSSGTPKYRVVSGGVIGAEQNAPAFADKSLNWMRAARSPDSQQIVVAALNSDKALIAAVWNGSAWSASTRLAVGLESNDKRAFDIAAEPTGGRLLAMYAQSGSATLQCRLWTGSSWGGVFNGPTGDGTHGCVFLATGTSGSTINIGVFGLDKDLLASVWNGDTFTSTAEVSTGSIGSDSETQPFFIASAPAGSAAEEEGGGGGSRRITRWKELGR